MGFLSKAFKRVKKQIRPNNMMIGNIRKMPRRPGMIGDMRFRGRMPKRGGFGFGLGEAIRRLQEKKRQRLSMPRMPSMDFGDQIGYKRPNKNPDAIAFDNPSFRMIGKPQPIPERMPTDPSSYYNPTIFGQPIGDMDFSQMPKISPEDMMNLQVPTDMPMTQDLPKVAPVGMMPQKRMGDMQDMEPRMMMQEGEDVSLERELFSLQAQLKNLEEQLRLDRSYNDDQAVIDTSAKMASIQKRIQEIMNGMPQLAEGGEPFPDFSGDGQITRKDILIGQGVKFKAEGGEMMMEGNEIDAMLGGMGSEVEGAMEDLEQMSPEMEMIDQLVTMVVQMIQQGASEEEVMMFLKEQGLDDEDIGTVLQLVAEMAEAEAMPQDGIGAELEQLA